MRHEPAAHEVPESLRLWGRLPWLCLSLARSVPTAEVRCPVCIVDMGGRTSPHQATVSLELSGKLWKKCFVSRQALLSRQNGSLFSVS